MCSTFYGSAHFCFFRFHVVEQTFLKGVVNSCTGGKKVIKYLIFPFLRLRRYSFVTFKNVLEDLWNQSTKIKPLQDNRAVDFVIAKSQRLQDQVSMSFNQLIIEFDMIVSVNMADKVLGEGHCLQRKKEYCLNCNRSSSQSYTTGIMEKTNHTNSAVTSSGEFPTSLCQS